MIFNPKKLCPGTSVSKPLPSSSRVTESTVMLDLALKINSAKKSQLSPLAFWISLRSNCLVNFAECTEVICSGLIARLFRKSAMLRYIPSAKS